MPYTIQVLENKEFDKLPYKYAKESLGAADPKNKIAYVRNTHWGEISKTINLLTIQHELEELIAKTSPHEEDGIRYKKGRDIIAPIATTIGSIINPFLGAAMAGGYGAYKQAKGEQGLGQTLLSTALAYGGGTLAQGARGGQTFGEAFKAGTTASTAAGGGILGQTLSGIQSGITGTSGAQTALLASRNPLIGVPAPTGANAALNQAAMFSAGTPAGRSLLATSALSNIGQQPGLTQIPGQAIRTPGIAGGDILKGLTNPLTMMGIGSMGMSAMSTSTTPPDIGPIVSKWLTADTVTKAGAAAKAIADVEYLGEFQVSKEIQAYTDVMEKDIRKAYKQKTEDIDKMASVTNENWMRSGERLELYRRMATDEQGEVDKMKAEWILSAKQQYSQNQYNYVISNLNADETTKRDLLYGELSDVIWKYNIQEADLMNFRKIAADAGMYLMKGGLGLDGGTTSPITINMGG